MKKANLIIIVYLFFMSLNLFSTDALKVLILPFTNNSFDGKGNIYSTLIQDTIKTDLTKIPKKIKLSEFEKEIIDKIKNQDEKKIILSFYKTDILNKYYILNDSIDDKKMKIIRRILFSIGYKKFIPILLKDISQKENITDYREIYHLVFIKGIDLIITGHYIEKNEKIRITFKVMDVLTERMKIVFDKTGEAGYEVFDIILSSTRELIKKMNENITSYPDKVNQIIREKQSRIIAGDQKERFIFFNVGIVYSGMGFINQVTEIKHNINIASLKNSYINSVNPLFKFEIYGNYKNNYFGFGFKFLIPFVYFVPNMMMHSDVSLSFIFGYKKEYFFDWSLKVLYMGFQKYGDFEEKQIMMFYLGIGFGFNFRYMPKKHPFFIEAGVTLLPPKIPYTNPENQTNGPVPWNITTGTISEKNWIFPVIFQTGVGYFFNKDFGIYIRNALYFMNISYEEISHYDEYEKKREYYGEDIGVGFDIEIGVVFKGIFR